MNRTWRRSSCAAGVLAALVAGAWALAAPGGPPPQVIKCPQPACTRTCDMSQWVIGYCTNGKNGQPFQATFECCCCGEDTKNHWFHGE